MTARFTLVAALLATAACGDECEPGYVDTYGFCTTDGEAFMLADAVAGAIIHLAVDVGAGTTDTCPDGGSVTRAEPAACHPICDTTWTFTDCRLLHNEAAKLAIQLTSGTITDHNTTVIGSPTLFTHSVVGDLELTATVRLKGKRKQEIGPKSCAFDFTYTQVVFGDTTITGSACDAEIQLPLYLTGL